MTPDEMTAIISVELKHIPKGYGPRHGWLRTYYNRYRRRDLSKGKKTKEETLLDCINDIRREDPNWHPEFDPTFFKM